MNQSSLFPEFDPDSATQETATSGPSVSGGPLVRVRLTIAYDGTDFRGLAPNVGVRTVVGELVRVLTPHVGYPPDIVMSGRTDAGVHASDQVLSFDVPEAKADLDRIQKMITSRLGPEIVALDVAVVDAEFSARFDATARRYRYWVLNRPTPDPFLARYSWHVADELNLATMRLACDPLLGEHDFSSFCRRPKVAAEAEPVSLVRRITDASWTDLGDGLLQFSIGGSAFCHQMVRSIVGFHVAVGRGKRSAGELRAVMAAKDRSRAETPAPPHGLTLTAVTY